MLKAISSFRRRMKASSFIDTSYYLQNYPDVAQNGADPVRHYLKHGWREGRNPSPDFNTNFYLEHYPDVAQSNANPLLHFIEYGRFENRISVPAAVHAPAAVVRGPEAPVVADAGDVEALISQYLDRDYYYACYSDVKAAGLDPVKHYIEFGWNEGRNPTTYFSSDFYLEDNSDVRASGLNPFFHYLAHGKEEGRSPSSPMLDMIQLKPVDTPWQKSGHLKHDFAISVVIPTYNRAHMLPSLLQFWREVVKRTRYDFEIIFSDDGSADTTLEVLEQATDLPITIIRNEHGGASKARNAAVRAARGEKILFLGDDIFPDPWLINRHVEKARELPVTDAILGLCDWHLDLPVNHLMRHITELGCEQFSFLHLPRHGYTDFRHFYTCNILIDREFLLSESVAFDERFYKVNFEDVELGYRLAKKGMRIYYYPEAYGDHFHPYHDVRKFCARQECAGEMAIVFRQLHREAHSIIPFSRIEEAWRPFVGIPGEPFGLYDTLINLCQEAEDQIMEHGDDVRRDLSHIYATLFRFAFEVGYCTHALPGCDRRAVDRIFATRLQEQSFKDALDRLTRHLHLSGYGDIVTALSGQIIVPHVQAAEVPVFVEQHAPVVQPAAAVQPSAAVRKEPVNLVTVVGQDLTHLNELMRKYAIHGDRLTFAIDSETAFPGLLYRPQPDRELSAASLGQILLFVSANPHIGRIVLSYGLHDLPRVGVGKDGKVEQIARSRNASHGKVIRIFDRLDEDAVDFASAFGNIYEMRDGNGHFFAR
jgi:glycosyltransferase involved in cell wall biosynthesis